MMKLRTLCLLALSCVAKLAAAKAAYGSSKLLVVTDGKDVQKDDYTKFWGSLRARGFDLTFRDARGTNPQPSELLTKYEEKQFDGLILFAPSAKSLPQDLSPQAIFSYLTTVSPGAVPGNVLIALSSTLSETWRDFAREFSIEFDERDTTLYDPERLDTSSSTVEYVVNVPTNHTFISTPVQEGVSTIISGNLKRSQLPIKYSGPVHTVTDIPLIVPVLRAPATAYPVEVKKGSSDASVVEGGPLATGEVAKLVSAFQTRLNSRVVWSGSVSMFSDAFWTGESANELFVGELSQWLFNEKSVVEIKSARHYLAKDPEKVQRRQYRIGEEMTYEIVLSSYEDGRWTAPNSIHDLQLEVTMLDPHLRIPLKPSTAYEHRSTSERTFTATFRLPDRHGVFTLLVDHRRQGTSWLESRIQTSITPLRHDEYERFIGGAFPYYVTAASMSIAWLLFSALWLSLKEGEDAGQNSKAKKQL